MLTSMAHFQNLSPLIMGLSKATFCCNTCTLFKTLTMIQNDSEQQIKSLISHFNVKSKIFQTPIQNLLYADDVELGHTKEDIQAVMDLFRACTAFGLKMKIMFTPSSGQPYVEPNIFVKVTRLDVIDSFKIYIYLLILKSI